MLSKAEQATHAIKNVLSQNVSVPKHLIAVERGRLFSTMFENPTHGTQTMIRKEVKVLCKCKDHCALTANSCTDETHALKRLMWVCPRPIEQQCQNTGFIDFDSVAIIVDRCQFVDLADILETYGYVCTKTVVDWYFEVVNCG